MIISKSYRSTLLWSFVLVTSLAGCVASSGNPQLNAVDIQVEITPSEEIRIPNQEEIGIPTEAANTNPFPLSEPGPYFVGSREYTIIDESRNGRVINLIIKYPAIKETNSTGSVIVQDALPDLSGAPYPLILTSMNSGTVIFKSHLASYGFVMVILEYPSLYDSDAWDIHVIDHPRDILFAIDALSANDIPGLKSMLDADRVGVAGYSSDGDKALVVSGARVNPDWFLSQCTNARSSNPPDQKHIIEWVCNLLPKWDIFSKNVGEEVTVSEDGLWQPITDPRIQAVMPMAAAGAWFFGKQGLAEVDRPTLIIAGTEDTIVPYKTESAYIYENLGTTEKYLISFIDQGHMMVFNSKQVGWINHFAIAFFGYYLQGRDEFAYYFSEDFVGQFNDLAWGIYSE
jgi:predicted dienelactone hydrolase